MPLPLSKNQIGKLGHRLRAGDPPAREDIELLHEVLGHYGDVLDAATSRVHRATGLTPTARVKNTGTILEKLDRHGGSSLRDMQDLAGMRIVGDFDRNGQDAVMVELVELFADGSRPARVVDRRSEPVSGYRAVHVIVFPEAIPVEIQIRTRAQHEWAELFEKLADRLGRGIRYGEAPASGINEAHLAEPSVRELFEADKESRAVTVKLALLTADFIDVFERLERTQPDADALRASRREVAEAIAHLARRVDEFARLDDAVQEWQSTR